MKEDELHDFLHEITTKKYIYTIGGRSLGKEDQEDYDSAVDALYLRTNDLECNEEGLATLQMYYEMNIATTQGEEQ